MSDSQEMHSAQELSPEDSTALVERAFEAREMAYAPYSCFHVGAALLTEKGTLYTGANIENASYTVCCCAERVAFYRALSAGERRFRAIAVVGGAADVKRGEFRQVFPCGVCRQVMAEFCPGDFTIFTAKSPADYQRYSLDQLLPEAFGPENLRADG